MGVDSSLGATRYLQIGDRKVTLAFSVSHVFEYG